MLRQYLLSVVHRYVYLSLAGRQHRQIFSERVTGGGRQPLVAQRAHAAVVLLHQDGHRMRKYHRAKLGIKLKHPLLLLLIGHPAQVLNLVKMFPTASLLALSYAAVVYAQQAGTLTAETHPKLSVSTCTSGGSCTSSTQTVVLDANWRWVHSTSSATNCYTGKL